MNSLFVTVPSLLESPNPGGVQICSQEYMRVLAAAGFPCRVWPAQAEYTVPTRARRRVLRHLNTFSDFERQSSVLADEVERSGVRDVFLNMVDVAPIAKTVKERLGDRCRITLLSHGLGSADFLHELRMARGDERVLAGVASDAVRLGLQLFEEVEQRRYFDHVLCLSETERELELWLGARKATWLPRVAQSNPLDWQPVVGRVGFVGTLDHPPNAEGLKLYLNALRVLGGSEVRIVGGPERAGRAFAQEYPFVTYLGPLDQRGLEAEAATWMCMVHPLFCFARGCSTKLAVGLGWAIPVATTPSGRRGYSWREGELPIAETPDELAQLTLSLRDVERRDRLRRAVQVIGASMPTTEENAELLRRALAPRPAL